MSRRSMRYHKILLAFLLAGPNAHGKLLPDEQNSVEIYQKCNPSVVNITAVTLRRDFFFEVYPQKGMGSGAIIRPDGYIVTNDHVTGNANQVEVTLHDKSTFTAKIVGRDPDSDLAILKINPKGKTLSILEMGGGENPAVGQKVLAIGNPFGLGGSLSVGVISSLGRDIRASTGITIKDVIQTDAAINPGNSGGPLLDSSGKLIGINTQIVSTSGGSEGIGFAISVKTLKQIVGQLIQYGKVLRPWLGFEGVELSQGVLSLLEIPSAHGVMITELYRGGPAAKSGLREAKEVRIWRLWEIPYGGDVIHQIDNIKVESVRDILDAIFEKKTGDSVVIHYFRKRSKRQVTVKLELPPDAVGRSL